MDMKGIFEENLKLHIQAGYPVIYIETVEEQRVISDIISVANTIEPSRDLFIWDYIKGYHNKNFAIKDPFAALEFIENRDKFQPCIFILKDYHKVINVGGIIRYLRNIIPLLKAHKKTIIITANDINIPPEIEDDTVIIDYEYPSYEKIKTFILSNAKKNNIEAFDIKQIAHICQGLTLNRLSLIFKKVQLKYNSFNKNIIKFISDEKKQIIKKTGILEYIEPVESVSDIGGLNNFKEWIKIRKCAFLSENAFSKLPAAKGVLLTGIQGTGKSLCAKAVSNYWNVPLLRLDIGWLMGSFVGESEERTRKALKLADATAPCILWIDEVDKAFGGIGELHGDSGTARRVFGTIITWMQERKSKVFIIATANNIDVLPPEFMRRGRFDEIFFVDLPDANDRFNIISLHLRKAEHILSRQDIENLSLLTEGFSGAEIENAIIDALFIAYNKGKPLNNDIIIEALNEIVPLSITMKPEIDKIKKMVLEGRLRKA